MFPHPTCSYRWSGKARHCQTLPYPLDLAKTRFPTHGLGEGRTNRSGEGEQACTQVQKAGSQTKGDRRSRYGRMQAIVLVSTAFYEQDQRQGEGERRRGFLIDGKLLRCTSSGIPVLCLKLGPLGRAFVITNVLSLASWEKQQAQWAAGVSFRTDFQALPATSG